MSKRRLSQYLLLPVMAAFVAMAISACNSNDAKGGGASATPAAVTTMAADIKHVFVIVLENKSYSDTFGSSTQDPYLQQTLVPEGALLTQYYGTGHVSLDNYISMVSGQASTTDTQFDCLPQSSGLSGQYIDVVQTGTTPDGQVIASGGCVYPASVKSLPNQLDAVGLTWKGYMEDMGNDPSREAATCGHPPLNGTDLTNAAEAPSSAVPDGDQYATRHDPFMYFHSIIDSSECDSNVVNLKKLDTDLQTVATTPNFSFITPNLCNDGHDGDGTGAAGKGCVNGDPGGLTSADNFLKTWVPKIMASPAYQQDGLIVITFDEGNYTLQSSTDPSSGQQTINIVFEGQRCCDQQPGPNITRPLTENLVNTSSMVENIVYKDFGGDQIGAVLLSPFIKPGSTSSIAYNHYSLLRSLEDIYGVSHLGYAADIPSINYTLQTIGDDSNVFKSK